MTKRSTLSVVTVALIATAVAEAQPQPQILLVAGSPGNYTAQALSALNIRAERRSPGQFRTTSPFDYDLIIWGMDESRSVLEADREQVRAFVESGGVLLCFRGNDADGWLPSPMERDKSYELGQVLVPEHPVLTTPNPFTQKELVDVHGGSIYRAFCRLGPGWAALVSTGKPQAWDKTEQRFPDDAHFGLVEMQLGRGRIIMTQMIPAYHWFHDRNGDQASSGARLFENLLAYALSISHAEAASRPEPRWPEHFIDDLSELMTLPRGFIPERPEAGAWEAQSKGPYVSKSDRRGVWTVTHIDAPSAAGNFCELAREMPLPERAGPLSLRWYVSDTYCGGRERILGGANHGKTAFANERAQHRYAQVWVGDQLVWEQDVLGRNPQPARRRFYSADITDIVPKDAGSCRVRLRVEDRKGSDDKPFAIDVFWAAVQVLPGLQTLPAGKLSPPTELSDGSYPLSPAQPATLRLPGTHGRFRVAVRLRDRVSDRPRLTLKTGGRTLAAWQLTADDHRWHWAVTPLVELEASQDIILSLDGPPGSVCDITELALLPEPLCRHVADTPAPARPQRPAARALDSFTLTVQETAGVARNREVVTQGLPFAEGCLREPKLLCLAAANGERVPCQASRLASWPDGSVRIALTSLPVSCPANGSATFRAGTTTHANSAPDHPTITIEVDADEIRIDTGVISATVSKTHGRVVDRVSGSAGTVLKSEDNVWDLALEDETGRVVRSGGRTVTSTLIADTGPLRVLIVRCGSCADADGRLLDYRLQLEATAGSDALGLEAIIINREDTAETYLKRWSMHVAAPAEAPARVWLGPDEAVTAKPGSVLYQHREDRLSWTDPAAPKDWGKASAPGLFRLGQVAVGARWFWQRFPQAIRFGGDGVRFDFIPPALDERDLPEKWQAQMAEMTTRYPVGGVGYPQSPGKMGLFRLARGEALHQELRFVFGGAGTDADTAARMAPLNDRLRAVPRPDYTAATRAFGQFQPAGTTFPRYEGSLDGLYQNHLAKRRTRREYGFENFGDDTFEWGYGPSYTYWSNSEYDHHHGFALQYLRNGDPRWWELAEQQARMYRDVVVIHHGPDSLRGGPRHHNATSMWMPKHDEQYWVADHTAHGPSCGHSWAQGMIDYWFLTGDPWSGEVVRELAQWYCTCVETNRYGAGGQERGPGWALIAISALNSALQTDRLQAAGSTVVDWIVNWQDPMRGVLSIPISEQPSYEGGTVFMHGIVGRALGRWYDATGDQRARLACIGIAEWMTTEPMGQPGQFWYKQSPNNSRRYSATSQCLTGLTYAYQLSRDDWFAQIALALYRQTGGSSRSISWYPQALAHLAPVVTPAEVTLEPDALVAAPGTPGHAMVRIRNTTDAALSATFRSTAPARVRLQCQETVDVPAGESREVSVDVAVDTPDASGEATLELTLQQDARSVKRVQLALDVRAVERIVNLELAADQAVLTAPMVLDRSGPEPSVHTPRTAAFVPEPGPATGDEGGFAMFAVDIPSDGQYRIGADVYWLDPEGNSFYISIDGEPDRVFGNAGEMRAWIRIEDKPVTLTEGKHTVRIRTREDGAKLRRLVVRSVVAQSR